MGKYSTKLTGLDHVLANMQNLKQGALVYVDTRRFHENCEFDYFGRHYKITLAKQRLQVLTSNGEYVDAPLADQGRISYNLYDGNPSNKSHTVFPIAAKLNFVLLVENGISEYLDNHYEVNHRSMLKQSMAEFREICSMWFMYRECTNDMGCEKAREYLDACHNSKGYYFDLLRKTTDDFKHKPMRLRVDDVSNLEFCTSHENTVHNSVVSQLRKTITDVDKYALPAKLACEYAVGNIDQATFLVILENLPIASLDKSLFD